MNPETLTQKLHAKSDSDLRAKIIAATAWIHDDLSHSEFTSGDNADFLKLVSGSEIGNLLTKVPWIGSAINVFTETAFAYLRDKYRQRAVADFMAKVESMAEQMQELGMVIAENAEGEQ
jgi:hypothetical protein